MSESFEPLDDETAQLPSAADTAAVTRVARVNLLPAEIGVERRQRRIAKFAAGLLAAYVLALGGLYALKVGDVNDARAERDETDRQVALLRTEVESLAEYQKLLDTVENRETLLTAAMDKELSWARILGDLALSFDRQASLIGLTGESTEPGVSSDGAVADTDAVFDMGDPVAKVDFTGYSVDRFAPGVEEVLATFDDANGFYDSYLSTAGEEERGTSNVTNFIGRVQLDERAYTNRYDDGLPEESVR